MREADILQSAIKKAEQNGYNFKIAKLGILYIFTHEFAKAFWGNHIICTECLSKTEECENHLLYPHEVVWAYHLQKMVLEPEPLKYLERFL